MPNLLVEWLKFEEGFRSRPYLDTVSVKSVGYGRNLKAHPIPGRNWTTHPCTEAEAEGWLRDELQSVISALKRRKPVIDEIDMVRAAALLNMAYQLGVGGVLGFRLMWEAVEDRAWVRAAKEAKDSRWARQTPERAKRVCYALETGEWPVEVLREASK